MKPSAMLINLAVSFTFGTIGDLLMELMVFAFEMKTVVLPKYLLVLALFANNPIIWIYKESIKSFCKLLTILTKIIPFLCEKPLLIDVF